MDIFPCTSLQAPQDWSSLGRLSPRTEVPWGRFSPTRAPWFRLKRTNGASVLILSRPRALSTECLSTTTPVGADNSLRIQTKCRFFFLWILYDYYVSQHFIKTVTYPALPGIAGCPGLPPCTLPVTLGTVMFAVEALLLFFCSVLSSVYTVITPPLPENQH